LLFDKGTNRAKKERKENKETRKKMAEGECTTKKLMDTDFFVTAISSTKHRQRRGDNRENTTKEGKMSLVRKE